MLILNIFIGITKADRADSITIKTKPNSVPLGRWLTTYGSKNMYSDNSKRPNNIGTNMTMDNPMYL